MRDSFDRAMDERLDKPSTSYRLNDVAKKIVSENKLIYADGFHYEYAGGVYREVKKDHLFQIIKQHLYEEFSPNKAAHVYESLKLDTLLPRDKKLNSSELINLKNGMFDLNTMTLKNHSEVYLSTIQLGIEYNPEATCPLWTKTLNEIFSDDILKADIIQEYFGLCLTKDQSYRKAIFFLGGGANGKNVIIQVLQKILGEINYSSIPLEKFNDHHYLASLYQKLANISTETNAKCSVYDAAIKAITSGDPMTADFKYGQQFQFNPFCKLVFALNNLPQVSDKTNSFFDRLLIVKFNRRFEEHEQNRRLQFELENELDGIFLWMINGLRNLRSRGYFSMTKESKEVINEYRRENNNVLLFVDDECNLPTGDPNEKFLKREVSKAKLYDQYKAWCLDSRHQALSKKKFGTELIKHFPQIKDAKDASGDTRIWEGICLQDGKTTKNQPSDTSDR